MKVCLVDLADGFAQKRIELTDWESVHLEPDGFVLIGETISGEITDPRVVFAAGHWKRYEIIEEQEIKIKNPSTDEIPF